MPVTFQFFHSQDYDGLRSAFRGHNLQNEYVRPKARYACLRDTYNSRKPKKKNFDKNIMVVIFNFFFIHYGGGLFSEFIEFTYNDSILALFLMIFGILYNKSQLLKKSHCKSTLSSTNRDTPTAAAFCNLEDQLLTLSNLSLTSCKRKDIEIDAKNENLFKHFVCHFSFKKICRYSKQEF